jgi:hypothetical protein
MIFLYFGPMKLFSFLSSPALKPSWEFSAQHILWRVMFSPNGLIVIEDRDTESKSAVFSCFDTNNKSLLWKNVNFGEQWWIGLTAITNERLYLHGFRKPDMPEQKNITAVDLRSGTVLWKNTECTFIAIQSPYVYGYKDLFERRIYYRLDENTGAILEELKNLPDDIEPNRQYERTDFTFPQQVSAEENGLWTLVNAEEGFKSAEHIATEQYGIISVYSRNADPKQGLKNTLSVIDTSIKKKVYSVVLNESTPYPVPDSFFMDGQRIYYIKERKTFAALDLQK